MALELGPKIKKILLVFGAVFISFFLLSEHVRDCDEGVVLNQAWQMWQGKTMYVDFYEHTSPGSALLVFYLWKIIGSPVYLAAKLLAIFLYMVSALGVYLITFKLTRRYYLALGAVGFWLVANLYYAILNYNTQSTYAAVWLFYVLLLALERRKPAYYAAAGLVSAVLFWFLYVKGLILVCFSLFAIFLFSGNIKNKAANSLWFMAPFLALTALLHSPWSWETLYQAFVLFPKTANYIGVVPLYWGTVSLEVLVLLAFSGWVYLYPQKENWLLLFFQLGLFLSFFYNVDLSHFMANSFPLWILLALFLGKIAERFNKLPVLREAPELPVILLLAGFFIYSSVSMPHDYFSLVRADVLKQPRRGVFAIKELWEAKHIYSGPFMPGLYYEFGKDNPFTRINSLALCDKTCMTETAAIMAEVKPEFCLINYGIVKKYGYNRDNPVDNYIKANYKKCPGLDTGSIKVYARGKCPSAEKRP